MPTDKKPFANSYWVIPGRLLAGEYPLTNNAEESAVRLQNLLLHGVTRFINLTAEHELPDYVGHLPLRFGGKPVEAERLTIKDHGVPDKPEFMNLILDRIDAALQADEVLYVHCRAGIGRTGMVVGCHLVRQGLNGNTAIEKLNDLWQGSARSQSWPMVPETDAQTQFIRDYGESFAKALQRKINTKPKAARSDSAQHSTPHTLHDRYQGAILGMAVAEAIAAEWQRHAVVDKSIVSRLDQAGWRSDTAMTWALADSLLHSKRMHAQDQMQRYLSLIKQKQYCSDNQVEPVPELVSKAVALWQWKRLPLAGSHDPAMINAHSLARVTAVALYYARQPALCLQEAANSSRTTLQSPIVLDACRVFAAVMMEVLAGTPLTALVAMREGAAFAELRKATLKPQLQDLIDGGWRHALLEPAGEDVITVLASALHALFTTHDFAAAIARCAQHAKRPTTVAAVCGALAGALYGVQGLPIVWRETLPRAEELLQVAERLLVEAPTP